ncbi:MAG TPA: hypothetical protein VK994_02535, partial [Bacteroidales bacterium]|nr:hypothetical protein [Bacteroidales bacterium]
IKGENPWSATGNSAIQRQNKWTEKRDISEVEGKIGAFISRRRNEAIGIESEITVFVPDASDYVELMKVTVRNISGNAITFTPVAATAIFGRHADNFRDHRQVTSMFQKVYKDDHGVVVKPNIVHDEHGHSVNHVRYAVLGFEANGDKPAEIWPLMYDFIGEGGSLDNPEAVFNDMPAPVYAPGEFDGQEAIGAMRFKEIDLPAGEEVTYIILHGITDNQEDLDSWKDKFNNTAKFNNHLLKTIKYWEEISNSVSVNTGDFDFDNWVKWISFQIKCRQIFGNSYLPDFGYGRGGRGWRDLWQDLLSIFLVDPDSAREEMVNSLKGIRVDGSNATIIGTTPGTFVADRNNVPRTWCDHGAWPVFVINFYIQQTGDIDILFREIPYWKDQFSHRSKKRDGAFDAAGGNWQKTTEGAEYHASIFEHLLIQQLSAFYHVGEHNILLLEGGDWNDTYDMAREKGESTGFYAFYAENLRTLASWLKVLAENGIDQIALLRETNALINTNGHSKPYTVKHKQARLKKYFDEVSGTVSGEKIMVGVQTLILDLMLKAEHITEVLREQEWISLGEHKGFFNGHYDNKGQAVDGERNGKVMMDLTTQVMATMHNLATRNQVRALMNSADRYLKDGRGYRLCTPFSEIDMNVGRITGFVYGHKEHGSKWMQQNIMLAYGLYCQGFDKLAHNIILDAYSLSTDSATSKIFPGLPSYFAPGDKAAYAYLTGSSTWFLLTLTTQIFGVRGEMGRLCLQPRLQPSQFDDEGMASINCIFRGIKLSVCYHLDKPGSSSGYRLDSIVINDKVPALALADDHQYVITMHELEELCNNNINHIMVTLKSSI